MTIDKNTDMLLFRFRSFGGNSFISSHQEKLRNAGFVWMLKIGKRSNIMKLNNIKECGGWLVLRAPKADGSKSYIAKFTDISEEDPEDAQHPDYYEAILSKRNDDEYYNTNTTYQWFRIVMLEELRETDADNLVVAKTGKKVNDVLRTTRTAVMFIKNGETISL